MQPVRVLRGDSRVGRKGMRIMGEAENTQRFDCIVNFFPMVLSGLYVYMIFVVLWYTAQLQAHVCFLLLCATDRDHECLA